MESYRFFDGASSLKTKKRKQKVVVQDFKSKPSIWFRCSRVSNAGAPLAALDTRVLTHMLLIRCPNSCQQASCAVWQQPHVCRSLLRQQPSVPPRKEQKRGRGRGGRGIYARPDPLHAGPVERTDGRQHSESRNFSPKDSTSKLITFMSTVLDTNPPMLWLPLLR